MIITLVFEDSSDDVLVAPDGVSDQTIRCHPDLFPTLHETLREYQRVGLAWSVDTYEEVLAPDQ